MQNQETWTTDATHPNKPKESSIISKFFRFAWSALIFIPTLIIKGIVGFINLFTPKHTRDANSAAKNLKKTLSLYKVDVNINLALPVKGASKEVFEEFTAEAKKLASDLNLTNDKWGMISALRSTKDWYNKKTEDKQTKVPLKIKERKQIANFNVEADVTLEEIRDDKFTPKLTPKVEIPRQDVSKSPVTQTERLNTHSLGFFDHVHGKLHTAATQQVTTTTNTHNHSINHSVGGATKGY